MNKSNPNAIKTCVNPIQCPTPWTLEHWMKSMISSSREIATGTGLNLQLETPLREEMPRLPAPNFFYAQATKVGFADWHSQAPVTPPGERKVTMSDLFVPDAPGKPGGCRPLYERYRPSNWSDVIGQEKAVRQLQANAKRQGWSGQAYFISGASGTGKRRLPA